MRIGIPRPLTCLAVALATVAVAGCGGGEEEPEQVGFQSVETPTPSATPDARIAITGPDDGSTVTARTTATGAWSATVEVTGTATPGVKVLVASDCQVKGCAGDATPSAGGDWSATVRVQASRRDPSARIEVYTVDSDVLDRIELDLQGPEASSGGGGSVELPATESEPTPTATAQPTAPSTPTGSGGGATGSPRRVVLVGDSLAVGIQSILPGLLSGYEVSTDALTGRPLAAGMSIVNAKSFSQPTVLAVSLFTNDDPRNVPALEAAVRASVARAGAQGCAVWATIVRPPVSGTTYAAANAKLNALAAASALRGHLIIVPWAEQVAAHPEWVGSDGVHGTATGYQQRAQLYASAIRSCGA